MRFERNLQVRLQERYRTVMKSRYTAHQKDLAHFRDFMQRTPALRAIAQAVASSEPGLDADAFIEQNFTFHGYDWPPTELGKLKVCWRLINKWADEAPAYQMGMSFTRDNNFQAMTEAATEAVVEPFVAYLQEQLGTSSDILYALERYRRLVEWFDQANLIADVEADSQHKEATCERHFRRFLFEQGIDYPFSQPSGPSGEPDVVGEIDTDDPLVCEVKLFDGASYNDSYVAKGLSQAVRYASDYGKPVAYLVVFNVSEQPLDITSDESSGDWPPSVQVGDVRVYVAAVQVKPLPTASRSARTGRHSLSLAELKTQVTEVAPK